MNMNDELSLARTDSLSKKEADLSAESWCGPAPARRLSLSFYAELDS